MYFTSYYIYEVLVPQSNFYIHKGISIFQHVIARYAL